MFEAEKIMNASSDFRTGFRRTVLVSALVSVAALSSAASITYTQTPLFAAVDNSSSVSTLPQFNPALGKLTSVTVTYADATFSASEVVNMSNRTETAARWSTCQTTATVSSGAYSSSDSVTALTYFGTDATGVAADSGSLAGGLADLGNDTKASTPSYTYLDTATLAAFTGSGDVTISNTFVADGWTDAIGPQFGFIVNFGSAQSSITYNYTSAPAPAAAGTMLIGLLGAMRRRRKS